jgi:MoaA/NifB/PqqE/SkfB family radical SAM enzyme
MKYTPEYKIKNEDQLWDAVDQKQTYIPFLPPRITFITSKRCNLSCRFCYHFAHKYIEKRSPLDMPAMDLRLIEKVAEELFPTLQYYETTLLGDPFLSPHLDDELRLAERYSVFMRPTTNGTTLTEANLDKVDGRMDWLKCSFDSHIRGIYNNIRIGARFENTVKKLKRFALRRESMTPKPYFRLGIVLNDLNLDTFPEYITWAHEELGVDDVEMMGLNVDRDHFESMSLFGSGPLVNQVLDQAIDLALNKKYKLRMDFTQMPVPGGDRFVCQRRSAELQKEQKSLGFIPPRDFARMSYVIQNPRNHWEINDLGFVWSNNMRRQDVCVEFFNRPFIIDNGNVEACGNCDTFLMGNMKKQKFSDIWNNELYQDVRLKMYGGEINVDWYPCCNDCICMGVTYDRGRSDHRHRTFYRVTKTLSQGEARQPVGDTHCPVDWPQEMLPNS